MAIKMRVLEKYYPGYFPAFIVFRQAGILIVIAILSAIALFLPSSYSGRDFDK
ncbi:MAG: hypothetical protein R2828_19595 [Saprospiraceae bacterium]